MAEFDWNLIRNPDPNWNRLFMLAWGVILGIFTIWGVFSSFYTVDADEEGVILRFGKYHETSGPGFHGKLPWGIDRVYKEKVLTVKAEEFGYRTVKAGVQSRFLRNERGLKKVATMLTGDLNLAMVNWEVRFKINDLKLYLFKVRNVRETLRDISESVMRTVIGDRSIDEVLTLDRLGIERDCEERVQNKLNSLECGLTIVKVNLKGSSAPDEVRSAFDAVNQAIQVRDRIINEAEGEVNRRIPAARGAAEKLEKEAEGYKIGRINRAMGDTTAFLSVLAEYTKAQDVTRRRLYLEAMEKVLPTIGNVTLVDGKAGGVLKILDLQDRKEGR